jgi:hypothetical protein
MRADDEEAVSMGLRAERAYRGRDASDFSRFCEIDHSAGPR